MHSNSDNSQPVIKNDLLIKEYKVSLDRKISFKDFLCLFQILRIIKNERPDIIHCHSAKAGLLGRLVGALCGVKTFYTPHAFSFLSSQNILKRKIFIFLEKVTKFRTILLACSNSEAKLARDIIGYNKDFIKTWSNSVPDVAKTLIRSEIDIKTPCVSTIGRPSFQKNSIFLLKIFEKIIKQKPNIKLYILGVGHYSPNLEEVKNFIDNKGLSDNIILIPWLSQSDIHQYILKSDFYVSTSLYEGLPLGIIEALSLSKPIVASKVYGNVDCVIDNKNGYLINLNEKEFVEKILELIDNSKKKKEFSRFSRELYEDKFNIEENINFLENIYLSLF